jgi:hypothetical protein
VENFVSVAKADEIVSRCSVLSLVLIALAQISCGIAPFFDMFDYTLSLSTIWSWKPSFPAGACACPAPAAKSLEESYRQRVRVPALQALRRAGSTPTASRSCRQPAPRFLALAARADAVVQVACGRLTKDGSLEFVIDEV